MSTPSRSRTIAGLFAVGALLALAVSPVVAKEGAIAKLETFVHRDAQPGSTIEVGWSVFQISGDKQTPISGTPFYVRLTGPDGSSNEAPGMETPSGSGQYRATIVVPRGGIQDITVALAGTACYEGGGCQRADYTFPLTDDALVSGTPVGITTAVTPATATGSVSNGLAQLVAIGVAIALMGGIAALMVTRRRQVGIDAARR
jgi:hypothetical protein